MQRTLAIVMVPALIVLALGIIALRAGREDETPVNESHSTSSAQVDKDDEGQSPQPTDVTGTRPNMLAEQPAVNRTVEPDETAKSTANQSTVTTVGGDGKESMAAQFARMIAKKKTLKPNGPAEAVVTSPPTAEPAAKTTQIPVSQTPVSQTPVTQTPVTQTPVTQTPVTQTPVTQTPVTQTPVTQQRPAALPRVRPKITQPPPVPSRERWSTALPIHVARTPHDLTEMDSTSVIGQLTVTGDQFTNRSLKYLESLRVLSLSIEAVHISNSALNYVAKMEGLLELRLWTPGITDDGLRTIAGMSDLELLDLEGTSIQGKGLIGTTGFQGLRF